MLAFLGGTGPEGRGLALRLAMAGEEVIIGSRDQQRARDTAQSLQRLAPDLRVYGDENEGAAHRGDTVFLTFPLEAQQPVLEQVRPHLSGKVVVNVIAPLVFNRGRAQAIDVPEGSAAMQAQVLLPDSQVVVAFQNVGAADLENPEQVMEGDVVVCSDHREAREQVMGMVPLIPNLRAINGGTLVYARYVEGFTALLANINRIHKCHSSIRILGL